MIYSPLQHWPQDGKTMFQEPTVSSEPHIHVSSLASIGQIKDADFGLGAPITLFTEISNLRTSKNHTHHEQRFLYAGAHTITRIQYLMPRTPLLIKMLESKFTGPKNERSEEAWNKSLNMKWAIVDLTKENEEEQGSNPMEPLKEIKKKSVSEMLEEMRLREKSGGKESGKPQNGDEREEVFQGDEDP